MRQGYRIWPLGPQPGRTVASFVQHMGLQQGWARTELERMAADLVDAMAPRMLRVKPGRRFKAALLMPMVGQVHPLATGRLLCLVQMHDESVRYVALPSSPLGHDDGTCRNIVLRLDAVLADKDVCRHSIIRPWSGDHTQLLPLEAEIGVGESSRSSRVLASVQLSELMHKAARSAFPPKEQGEQTFRFPRPLHCSLHQDAENRVWSVSMCYGKTSVDGGSDTTSSMPEAWLRIAWGSLPMPPQVEALDDAVLPSCEPLRTTGILASNVFRLWRDYLCDGLRHARSAALLDAYAEFTRSMDPEPVEMLSMVPQSIRGTVHGWLMADGDRLLQIHRRQALHACPLLVSRSVAAFGDNQHYNYRYRGQGGWRTEEDPEAGVLQAIDEGLPLTDALCGRYRISRPLLRSLACLPSVKLGPHLSLDLLARASSCLSPSSLPSGSVGEREGGWLQLLRLLSALEEQTRPANPQAYIPLSFEQALQRERPFWRKKGPFPSFDAKHHDIDDMMSCFAAEAMAPAVVDGLRRKGMDILSRADLVEMLQSSPLRPSIVARTLGARRLAELAECSKHWHRNHARIQAGMVAAGDGRTWPALFDAVQLGVDGVCATPLTSSAMLAEEGAAMRHCVASYIHACLDGTCHIVSLRNADGGRLSTLEIEVQDRQGAQEPRLVQHCGPDNSDPPRHAHRAADLLLGLLHDEPGRIHRNLLEEAAAQRRLEAERDAFSLLCSDIGYDLDNSAGRNAALQGYRFLLQPSHRGLAYDEWVQASGLDRMLDEELERR
jgi:hypothetical protein